MPDGIFTNFGVSASGMSAQRRRLDIISENLANVETTRTPEGGPYRRKRAVMQSGLERGAKMTWAKNFMDLVKSNIRHLSTKAFRREQVANVNNVTAVVENDQRPFVVAYEPGHPDADEHGYVLKPNVNVVEEMVEMIKATRAYEANAAAFEAAKDMFNESLRI